MKKIAGICGWLCLLCMAGCTFANEKQQEVSLEQQTGVPEDRAELTKTPTLTKAPVTEAPGQEISSYKLAVTFLEEKNEAKEGEDVYFASRVYYPVFEGAYADQMNRFVEGLTKEFYDTLPEAEKNAAYDYNEVKAGIVPDSLFPEREELTINRVWETEQWQVLLCSQYSDIGGAHPFTYAKAYVVDVTDGTPIKIERVLEAYSVTKEALVEYAMLQIQSEYGDELYEFDDVLGTLREEVLGFVEEGQWYLNEEGLVLFANPYEIAPYVYGTLACEISYEVLEEGLKK